MNFIAPVTLLAKLAQNKPWLLIQWISTFLGVIINFIYDLVSSLPNALGVAIIVFTFIVRGLMFPLGISQQKSMAAMQKLAPEIEKINKKYGNSKDPEVKQKIAAEQQKLYAKHKVNPFGGCLPLLLQMPIFFALIHIMNNPYYYINKMTDFYAQIYAQFQTQPDFTTLLNPVFFNKIAKDVTIDYSTPRELGRILSVFDPGDWTNLLAKFPAQVAENIQNILRNLDQANMFFTLDLRANAGWGWPGIIIPVLTGITMFLSSWLTSRQQPGSGDAQQKMTQKIMLFGMPLMMAWMTITVPMGVGIYWITTSVFQLVQQLVLNKYFGVAAKKEEA